MFVLLALALQQDPHITDAPQAPRAFFFRFATPAPFFPTAPVLKKHR